MSVQSRDERKPRAALFSRHGLAERQKGTERLIGIFLLVLSFAGGLIFGGGGVDTWLQLAPNLVGVGSSLAVQFLCTRVQWIYSLQRWRSPYWLIAFGISTGLSLLGFWPLLHGPLTGVLQDIDVPNWSAPYIAGVILVIGAGLLDYLPEQILTD